jgi:hypothetical protein
MKQKEQQIRNFWQLKKSRNGKETIQEGTKASEELWRWSWPRQWIVIGKVHLLGDILKLHSYWTLSGMLLLWWVSTQHMHGNRRRGLQWIQLIFCKTIEQKWLVVVYHSYLYFKFSAVASNNSYNQVYSIKYSSPYYPTCQVKQEIFITLQNPQLQQNHYIEPQNKYWFRKCNKLGPSSVNVRFLQKIRDDLWLI